MKNSDLILIFGAILTIILTACADGSNVERSAARSLENAGSVYKKYEPKIIGPGESPTPNPEPTPSLEGNRY